MALFKNLTPEQKKEYNRTSARFRRYKKSCYRIKIKISDNEFFTKEDMEYISETKK